MNDSSAPYLIVGLGNPGKQHRQNRHNVGFMLLDTLAKQHEAAFTRRKSNALITETYLEGKKLLLVKPQTYMNNSGRSVAPLMHFFRIPAARLFVAYDELDLPMGTIRIRPTGGSGGHRGMRSIIHELGIREFPRMRIGIDRPPGRMDPADYVLYDFSPEEQIDIASILDRAAECVRLFIHEGIQASMNCCNAA